MSKQVHTRIKPDGTKEYRIWSDNSNTYSSNVLNLEQLRLFEKLMHLEQPLFDFFCATLRCC